MKFVLAFAMGMTIFSKIAQAEILPTQLDVHKLVVAVTETKGVKKDGNLKRKYEQDKIEVKV